MGRTNPTYRDLLRAVEDDLSPFRRALRREHQADFDRLFERADRHADAAAYLNPTDPERAILWSILLSQEHAIQQLEAKLVATRGVAERSVQDHDTRAGEQGGRDAES